MKSFNFLIAIFIIFLICSDAVADDQNYKDAGEFYEINYLLLKAIAQTESGQNPNAVNCANSNGTCDYGIMQVNSVHLSTLKKNGIPIDKLLDEKVNIYMGAWVLKGCIGKYGFTSKTLNCYNGKINGNNYYSKVLKNYDMLAKSSGQ
ncbi:MAG: lytic transglycosylase domain-containing protein [Thiovulaceae bacterium]|nr:lytic transglycosylase domain-containing protein [Sulfurimonadaceae bacterium]